MGNIRFRADNVVLQVHNAMVQEPRLLMNNQFRPNYLDSPCGCRTASPEECTARWSTWTDQDDNLARV